MSTVVSIDIGSHKICTLIGEALPGGGVRVLGMGHAPAVGIRRSEVVHVEDAAGAIAASVERAERVAGIPVRRAVVGMTGTHIASQSNHAVVPIGRRPREVEQADVQRVLETAGAVPLPAGREVLHVLPRYYQLDGGGPVVSPLGMEGYRIEVGVHIVTAASAALTNLRRCLSLAEVAPSALVFSTLAAAEATLTRDERELGVMLVDLGAAATGVACYREGALVHSAVLPVGSRHMTNDLAVLLQTPLDQAERIKTASGHVLPELDDDDVAIDIVPFGEAERRTTTRHHVSEVLAARADEIARLVLAEIERKELHGQLPAGVVLCGGGTELSGLPRRLYEQWGLPVRIGRASDVIGLGDAAKGPSHAAAVGLLLWGARRVPDAVALTVGQPGRSTDGLTGLEKMMTWARTAFLPSNGRDLEDHR
jgi:cell division protein FtsA